ncbi:MAG: hypothetical protein HN368_19650, partial [Spirochaetales bacterium]|nr:hypothetical protein [Spirochaetales bacterium]
YFARGSAIHAATHDTAVKEAMALSLKYWGGYIIDAGVYCPQISDADKTEKDMSWGLCQLPDGVYTPWPEAPMWSPFILRFDRDLKATA